ncbi:MAG: hypothetical protein GEU78_18090 [Actinobacteria bacterium]|nr:hypothetical protein [Actinomycetota bacterium]
MAAQRKYSLELRERATRMALEARQDPASKVGAVKRIADQLGVHPEGCGPGSSRPRSTAASGRGRRLMTRPGSPSWSGRSASCAARTRFSGPARLFSRPRSSTARSSSSPGCCP